MSIIHNPWLLVFTFSDCKNYKEISEDWFDAKENLTGADFSGTQGNQIGQGGRDPKVPLGWFLTIS